MDCFYDALRFLLPIGHNIEVPDFRDRFIVHFDVPKKTDGRSLRALQNQVTECVRGCLVIIEVIRFAESL